VRARLAWVKLERSDVMVFCLVGLGQSFIGDPETAMGGGIAVVEAERPLEQGNGPSVLAGLNFQGAVKAETIGIFGCNLS
jgi:hypothetical protein